jgi:hypothetical protein
MGKIGRDRRRHEAVIWRGSERDCPLVVPERRDRRDAAEDLFIKGAIPDVSR